MLLESHDIARMGVAADEIRVRRHPDNIVTYIIDRNINYTNVCNVVCTFCAFYRRPGAPDTYVRTFDEICKKIDETIALGGTGVLMQGGLHPDFGIEWYEDLLRSLRAKYPGFQLHCFSPPEIHNIHLISKLDYETIMARLKDAGLYSLPGGGAEILDDEVRKRVATKCTTDEWLDVMRAVHRVGLRSTATMMFGIGDKIEHRVTSLAAHSRSTGRDRRIHRVHSLDVSTREHGARPQDQRRADRRGLFEDAGGVAAVPRQHRKLSVVVADAGFAARAGRVAFRRERHGLDHDRGERRLRRRCHNQADEKMLQFLIREAGFIPQQRDILYKHVTRPQIATEKHGQKQNLLLRFVREALCNPRLKSPRSQTAPDVSSDRS